MRHLAFGTGAHVCAGSRLVRLIAPIVLNLLLDRFSRIEPVGDPTDEYRRGARGEYDR